MKKTTVLIIGGTGFIGSHLVKEALNSGFEVNSLSLDGNKSKLSVNSENVNSIVTDICDEIKLRKTLYGKKIDFTINTGDYIDHSLMKDVMARIRNEIYNDIWDGHIQDFISRARSIRKEILENQLLQMS